jgi:hypothetical protein
LLGKEYQILKYLFHRQILDQEFQHRQLTVRQNCRRHRLIHQIDQ